LAISIPRPADRLGRPDVPRGALAFVAAAGVFVAVVALFAVSRSSLFALRHVEVVGSDHRSPADIRERAALDPGANVVWLDTAAVEQRLESDPWIADATVTRSLPWTVRIAVEERTPVAEIAAGETRALVAADGTWLGPAPHAGRLPSIVLPPAAPATVGVPGEGGAVRALAAMSPSVRQRVREVRIAIGGTLTLRLNDGSTVRLGAAVDLNQKMRMLRRLLAWERDEGTALRSISLLAPSAPAAEPAV
jgi:cell division protein FtsQ